MSYIDRTHDNSRRTQAIIGVAAIHAAMGYALITGLASGILEQVEHEFRAVTFPTAPQPTPTPQPTLEPVEIPPSYTDPVAPKPPVDLGNVGPITMRDFDPAKVSDDLIIEIPRQVEPGPVEPSPTPALFRPKAPAPTNGPAGWVSTRDYPGVALRQNLEGTTGYRLVVGTNGCVNACEITSPSGTSALDDATCKLISRRARFDSATNDQGAKVVGTYTGSVTWQIPD